MSLLLVCGMILGCFAGCSEVESQDGKSKPKNKGKDEDEKVEELHDVLDRHKWNGLKFYLSEDFEEVYDSEYGTEYEHEDEDMTVRVEGLWVEDEIGSSVTSAKKLMEAYIEEWEDTDIYEKSKANGTPYFYGEEGGQTGVAGFYYKDVRFDGCCPF